MQNNKDFESELISAFFSYCSDDCFKLCTKQAVKFSNYEVLCHHCPDRGSAYSTISGDYVCLTIILIVPCVLHSICINPYIPGRASPVSLALTTQYMEMLASHPSAALAIFQASIVLILRCNARHTISVRQAGPAK